jgi:hypothetical protein
MDQDNFFRNMHPVNNNTEKPLPSLVVVIPIYKKGFDQEEQYLVDRMFSVFSKREIVFVAPKNLDKTYYFRRYSKAKLAEFPESFFGSVQAYSRLLLSRNFYEVFEEKDYLLISQPDVYVFHDDLDAWLRKSYDYVGAPWLEGYSIMLNMGRFANERGGTKLTAFVGNGGFSLRKIASSIALLDQDRDIAEWFANTGSNEDLFFSFIGAMTAQFVLPNTVEASLFAMELNPDRLLRLNGGYLPLAAHAFRKYSTEFWSEHIPIVGI